MSIVKDVAFLFLHTLFANAFNDPKNSKKVKAERKIPWSVAKKRNSLYCFMMFIDLAFQKVSLAFRDIPKNVGW